MAQPFTKMHGLGNDFVLFDAREDAISLSAQQIRALANRKTGIGCDQLFVIEPSTKADVFMRIYNADGSEVGACGNGTRCVARLVAPGGDEVRIETTGGILVGRADGDAARVDMGVPRDGWEEIPLAYAMDTLDMPVGWEELERPAALNVGNPHVTFFVADADAVPLERLGPEIENDGLFPEKVNVGVAQMLSRWEMKLRVWERGVGLTDACGTGACAAAVNAMRRRVADRSVTVNLPGGSLDIQWAGDDHILMTGPAEVSFTGEVEL